MKISLFVAVWCNGNLALPSVTFFLFVGMAFSAQQSPLPIDAVFTWVDGSDPVWLEQKRLLRQKVFGDAPAPGDADNRARFQDNDELRYALRSLALYAPWIRTVHLVTADQKPAWINPATVNLVSHRDIFPDSARLPVFSNRPIEFCIHRVPGLAERFLSFNDDMLLGRPVSPGDFFLPEGGPVLWVIRRGKKTMDRRLSRLGSVASHASVIARAHELIRERYGLTFPYVVGHFPKAMTRSSVFALWDAFPAEISAVLRSPFRSPADIAIFILYPLYALAEGVGRARVVNGPRQLWDAVSGRGVAHMGASLSDRNMLEKMRAVRLLRPRTFCFNDAPGSSDDNRRQLAEFLASLFPQPCKYELCQG